MSPFLTGDRMAFATVTVHQAVFGEKNRWYLVGLASVGDAWFPDEDAVANAGFGGGIAIHGKIATRLCSGCTVWRKSSGRCERLTPWF